MPWGWSEPIYYNYGQNVVYDGDQVYYGDQPIATADEYTEQAEAIATSIPQGVQPAPDDWMPLGGCVRGNARWRIDRRRSDDVFATGRQ